MSAGGPEAWIASCQVLILSPAYPLPETNAEPVRGATLDGVRVLGAVWGAKEKAIDHSDIFPLIRHFGYALQSLSPLLTRTAFSDLGLQSITAKQTSKAWKGLTPGRGWFSPCYVCGWMRSIRGSNAAACEYRQRPWALILAAVSLRNKAHAP